MAVAYTVVGLTVLAVIGGYVHMVVSAWRTPGMRGFAYYALAVPVWALIFGWALYQLVGS